MHTSVDVHTKHALSRNRVETVKVIACSVKPIAVPELIYSIVLKWAEDWQMTFNPQKTEFLRITTKHNSISSSYYFKDISIPLSDHVKYLGVIIDKSLNWSQHINMIVAKANSARSFLQRNLTECLPTVKSSCYSTLVCPIIEYACTVWSPRGVGHLAKSRYFKFF